MDVVLYEIFDSSCAIRLSVSWFTAEGYMVGIIMLLSGQHSLISGKFILLLHLKLILCVHALHTLYTILCLLDILPLVCPNWHGIFSGASICV